MGWLTGIPHRDRVPEVLAAGGLVGPCVEVGVDLGHFSAHWLEHHPGVLWSVDAWDGSWVNPKEDPQNVDADRNEWRFREAVTRLAAYGDRSRVLRLDSVTAAGTFRAGAVDAVYVDARHDEAAVAADLRAWWPVIRAGGVLAGHDYYRQDLPRPHPPEIVGVTEAVHAWADPLGLTVEVTTDDGPMFTWLVQKPR